MPTKDQENLVPIGILRGEEEGASFGKSKVNTTTTSTAITTTAAAAAAVVVAAARMASGLVGELTATTAAGFKISTIGEETFLAGETGEVLVAVGPAGEAGDAGGGGGDLTTGITAERLRWRLGQPHAGGVSNRLMRAGEFADSVIGGCTSAAAVRLFGDYSVELQRAISELYELLSWREVILFV